MVYYLKETLIVRLNAYEELDFVSINRINIEAFNNQMDTINQTKIVQSIDRNVVKEIPIDAIKHADDRVSCSFEVSRCGAKYSVKAVSTHPDAKNKKIQVSVCRVDDLTDSDYISIPHVNRLNDKAFLQSYLTANLKLYIERETSRISYLALGDPDSVFSAREQAD